MRIFRMTAALVLFCATASAEKIAKPGANPIQAELMGDLHARLLKVGQTVFAHVTIEWRSPGCLLRNGAVLEGQWSRWFPVSSRSKPPKWAWPLPGLSAAT
jgi:hypothetical protein